MVNNLKRKTVIITGASKGIGRETALLFAKNEYNVVINYNKSEEQALLLENEINSKGKSAIAIKADISNMNEVKAMVDETLKHFKSIDVLVNNAGIAEQKMFCDITENDWENMLKVNVTGMFNTCKCVMPFMIHKKEGKIINVSSIWGLVGASCEVHYSTSKAAIIGFTKALAKELGPSNIKVNCVAPGVINTDMNANLDRETIDTLKEETPLGTIGKPIDIANAIYFLASDKSNFITGQVISPNGGFVI